MNAVEINSSFHRPHRRSTYEKWATATPNDFQFSIKVPKTITHVHDFNVADLDRFIDESGGLAGKLAVFLIQFSPSRAFLAKDAKSFFDALLKRTSVPLVCEPRHSSWFTPDVDAWLRERKIGRVGADPARADTSGEPGGWPGFRYFRLHGAPRIYYSSYDDLFLSSLAARLANGPAACANWCIFDNTAAGAALQNVLDLAI